MRERSSSPSPKGGLRCWFRLTVLRVGLAFRLLRAFGQSWQTHSHTGVWHLSLTPHQIIGFEGAKEESHGRQCWRRKKASRTHWEAVSDEGLSYFALGNGGIAGRPEHESVSYESGPQGPILSSGFPGSTVDDTHLRRNSTPSRTGV